MSGADLEIKDGHRVAVVLEQALPFKGAQPLIDALAGGRDQASQLLLGEPQWTLDPGRPVRPRVSQLNQDAGQAPWNCQEGGVLEELGVVPKPSTEHRQQRPGRDGVPIDECRKSSRRSRQRQLGLTVSAPAERGSPSSNAKSPKKSAGPTSASTTSLLPCSGLSAILTSSLSTM